MLKSLFITISLLGFTAANGQHQSEETYCLKLLQPSNEVYYNNIDLTPIQERFRRLYQDGLNRRGSLLSRFGEEPLANDTTKEIFRITVFSAYDTPEQMQIYRFEERENDAVLTLKVIPESKERNVVVLRKLFAKEKWNEFEALASKLFINQPSFIDNPGVIHDGSTTFYEGRLLGKYHFVSRPVTPQTNQEELKQYLANLVGTFFPPDCKADMRSK
jgi:hypothetical protein